MVTLAVQINRLNQITQQSKLIQIAVAMEFLQIAQMIIKQPMILLIRLLMKKLIKLPRVSKLINVMNKILTSTVLIMDL